jgi:hypothetical protein
MVMNKEIRMKGKMYFTFELFPLVLKSVVLYGVPYGEVRKWNYRLACRLKRRLSSLSPTCTLKPVLQNVYVQ